MQHGGSYPCRAGQVGVGNARQRAVLLLRLPLADAQLHQRFLGQGVRQLLRLKKGGIGWCGVCLRRGQRGFQTRQVVAAGVVGQRGAAGKIGLGVGVQGFGADIRPKARGGFLHGGALHMQDRRRLALRQRRADPQVIVPRVPLPTDGVGVVGAKAFQRDAQFQTLCRARLQAIGLGKGDQTAVFPVLPAARTGGVDLHGFPPGVPQTCVCHLNGQPQGVAVLHQGQLADKKLGVGKPRAEAVPHRHREGVKVAVADIDPLAVGQRQRFVAAGLCAGIVGIAIGPAVGQFAAWVHPPAQHVRQGAAALHAGLGEQHHGAHTVQSVQRRQIHDAADVQHQNDRLAEPAQNAQVAALGVRKAEVPRVGCAVEPLARSAAYHVQRGVAVGFFGRRQGGAAEVRADVGGEKVRFFACF